MPGFWDPAGLGAEVYGQTQHAQDLPETLGNSQATEFRVPVAKTREASRSLTLDFSMSGINGPSQH